MNPKMGRMLMLAPLVLAGFAAFVAAGGWVVQHLWNWLLPTLFGWPVLGWWQAVGLLALCRILFGGFGMHGGPSSRIRGRMEDRWNRMSPGERERIHEAMRGRFGFGAPTGGSTEA